MCRPGGILLFSDCTVHFPLSLPLQVVLPPHLDNVRDKLAENIHELWGMNKIELGWTYGKVNLHFSTMFNTGTHRGGSEER